MRYKISFLALLLGSYLYFIPAFAQEDKDIFHVKYTSEDTQEKELQVKDSLEAIRKLYFTLNNLHKEGYLIADYSFYQDTQEKGFLIEKGNKYSWAQLFQGNLPDKYIRNYEEAEKFSNGEPFSIEQTIRLFNHIVTKAGAEGYPFARVWFKTINLRDTGVSGELNFTSGPLITFDSVKISGYSSININWFHSYIDITPGDIYREQAFLNIPNRIQALDFIKLKNEPALTFANEQATIALELEYLRGNQFDAVIGFAPNAGENKSFLITGEADLRLNNILQRGHQLQFGWRSIKPQTQELDFHYGIPNIFNSPVSVSGDADLYRQDTIFLNYDLLGEISFRKKKWKFGTYTRFFRSVTSDNSSEAEMRDIKVDYVGLSIGYTNFNRVEYTFSSSMGVGKRAVEEATSTVNSIQSEIELGSLIKINNEGSFIRLRQATHWLLNESLYSNDLLRIGGIRTLRGFPENFFFVKNFTTFQNEYHWRFDEASSFFTLTDIGFLGHDEIKYAYGLGLGFDLKVNNGIFELIYAVGGYEDMNISFSRSVIHFGYKASF